MFNNEYMSLLSIAKEAALLAGGYLSEDKENSRRINKDLEHDVKIEADLRSEKIILDFLRKYSDFSILSEEKGEIQGENRDYVWVVDPLDGSLNYSRKIPICCLSIGLWKKETPVIGVIYDFKRGELFSGVVGQGAWLNDEPIHVSAVKQKGKSILFTGFPNQTDFSSQGIKNFVRDIQLYRKIRLLGSAALSIAYVASGRADAYYERGIMLWDVAGGIPIVLGAGGRIQMEKTSRLHCLNVYVTNAFINK